MIRQGFLITWILLGGLFASAQSDVETYMRMYEGESIVNLLSRTVLEIGYDNSGELEVNLRETDKRLYLTDGAAQFSEDQVSYSEHFQLLSHEAYALVPRGKKQKRIPVTEFQTKTEFSNSIFHDGGRSLVFFYPSLSKGAMTVLEYELSIELPQLLSSMFIGDYYPTHLREIEIRTAPGVNMEFSYRNADGPAYQPQVKTDKKGNTTYSWSFEALDGLDFGAQSPDFSYYAPHIIPRISSYSKDGEQVRFLQNTDDLYDWYRSLIGTISTETSDEIRVIVDSLNADATTDLERISNIYYWVQDNIKYVAFTEGMDGYIPEDAVAVCSKRFGDCKGLTSLMYSMLEYAGIQPYFSWVGTRDRPYRYEEVPTPVVDNHMILACSLDNDIIFLDGTSYASHVLEVPYALQGKEVLVGISEDEYRIVQVPVRPKDYNLYRDSIHITVDETGKLVGRGVTKFTGYYASGIRAVLKRITGSDLERYMESQLEKGSNKFALTEYSVSDFEDHADDITFEYRFDIEDYLMVNGDEMYLDMNLVKLYEDEMMKASRAVDYEVDFKSINQIVVVLDIPHSFEATYVPEALSYKEGDFGFDFNIEQKGNQIIQDLRQYDNFLIMDQSRFADWNNMIKNMRQIYRESIILSKKQ